MSVILDNEISKLKKSILILCGMVEEAVVDAVDAVMSNDKKKAERVTHCYELYLFWIRLVQFIENLY